MQACRNEQGLLTDIEFAFVKRSFMFVQTLSGLSCSFSHKTYNSNTFYIDNIPIHRICQETVKKL